MERWTGAKRVTPSATSRIGRGSCEEGLTGGLKTKSIQAIGWSDCSGRKTGTINSFDTTCPTVLGTVLVERFAGSPFTHTCLLDAQYNCCCDLCKDARYLNATRTEQSQGLASTS